MYVVTEGEYSDYHIVGVTTEKKKAEQYCKLTTKEWYEPEIETYDTDSFVEDLTMMKVYDVYVSESGNVAVQECESKDGYDYESAIEHEVRYGRYARNTYKVTVLAVDKEHAKKKGLDYIAKYKYEYKCEGGWAGED